MNKGCPIFEWISGITITDKDEETQSEEDEIYSTHEDKQSDYITENREYEESIK